MSKSKKLYSNKDLEGDEVHLKLNDIFLKNNENETSEHNLREQTKQQLIQNENVLKKIFSDLEIRLNMSLIKELRKLTESEFKEKLEKYTINKPIDDYDLMVKEFDEELVKKPIFEREYKYFQKKQTLIIKEIDKLKNLISEPLQENNFEKIRVVVWNYKRKLRKTILEKDWVEDPTQLNETDFLHILDIVKRECRIDYHWTRRKR